MMKFEWNRMLTAAAVAVGSAILPYGQTLAEDITGTWQMVTRLSEFDPPPLGSGDARPIQDIRGIEAMRAQGVYVTYMGDYENPILQPWASDVVKEHVDAELEEEHIVTAQEVCRASGTPGMWSIPSMLHISQNAREVALLLQRDHQVRLIHMNRRHPADLEPIWYGDSTGYWEGDTLVVDTVGQKAGTAVDIFGTPHTDEMRVTERFYLVDGENGQKYLRLHFTVNDPDTFTQPWGATITWRRPDLTGPLAQVFAAPAFLGPMLEEVCAEGNRETENPYPVEARYRYPAKF